MIIGKGNCQICGKEDLLVNLDGLYKDITTIFSFNKSPKLRLLQYCKICTSCLYIIYISRDVWNNTTQYLSQKGKVHREMCFICHQNNSFNIHMKDNPNNLKSNLTFIVKTLNLKYKFDDGDYYPCLRCIHDINIWVEAREKLGILMKMPQVKSKDFQEKPESLESTTTEELSPITDKKFHKNIMPTTPKREQTVLSKKLSLTPENNKITPTRTSNRINKENIKKKQRWSLKLKKALKGIMPLKDIRKRLKYKAHIMKDSKLYKFVPYVEISVKDQKINSIEIPETVVISDDDIKVDIPNYNYALASFELHKNMCNVCDQMFDTRCDFLAHCLQHEKIDKPAVKLNQLPLKNYLKCPTNTLNRTKTNLLNNKTINDLLKKWLGTESTDSQDDLEPLKISSDDENTDSILETSLTKKPLPFKINLSKKKSRPSLKLKKTKPSPKSNETASSKKRKVDQKREKLESSSDSSGKESETNDEEFLNETANLYPSGIDSKTSEKVNKGKRLIDKTSEKKLKEDQRNTSAIFDVDTEELSDVDTLKLKGYPNGNGEKRRSILKKIFIKDLDESISVMEENDEFGSNKRKTVTFSNTVEDINSRTQIIRNLQEEEEEEVNIKAKSTKKSNTKNSNRVNDTEGASEEGTEEISEKNTEESFEKGIEESSDKDIEESSVKDTEKEAKSGETFKEFEEPILSEDTEASSIDLLEEPVRTEPSEENECELNNLEHMKLLLNTLELSDDNAENSSSENDRAVLKRKNVLSMNSDELTDDSDEDVGKRRTPKKRKLIHKLSENPDKDVSINLDDEQNESETCDSPVLSRSVKITKISTRISDVEIEDAPENVEQAEEKNDSVVEINKDSSELEEVNRTDVDNHDVIELNKSLDEPMEIPPEECNEESIERKSSGESEEFFSTETDRVDCTVESNLSEENDRTSKKISCEECNDESIERIPSGESEEFFSTEIDHVDCTVESNLSEENDRTSKKIADTCNDKETTNKDCKLIDSNEIELPTVGANVDINEENLLETVEISDSPNVDDKFTEEQSQDQLLKNVLEKSETHNCRSSPIMTNEDLLNILEASSDESPGKKKQMSSPLTPDDKFKNNCLDE